MRTIAVPFRFSGIGGVATTTDRLEQAEAQILDVVMTNVFERPMRPRHGGNLRAQVFGPADELQYSDEARQIQASINSVVQIAKAVSVEIKEVRDEPNALDVRVLYQLVPYDQVFSLVRRLFGLLSEESPL